MKRTYINDALLNAVLKGEKPLNTPVGTAKDVHNTFFTGFVATYPEDHEPADLRGRPIRNKSGEGVAINWRKSTRQKTA